MNLIEQHFREGFATKLAELGVSPATLGARLREKQADWGEFLKSVGTGLTNVGKGTLWLEAFSPAIAAGIVGYMMAQSKRVSPADIKAQKDIMLTREMEEQRRVLAEQQAGLA